MHIGSIAVLNGYQSRLISVRWALTIPAPIMVRFSMRRFACPFPLLLQESEIQPMASPAKLAWTKILSWLQTELETALAIP
jgi:hypothetical protein